MNFKPNASLFLFMFFLYFIHRTNGGAFVNNSSAYDAGLQIAKTSLPLFRSKNN